VNDHGDAGLAGLATDLIDPDPRGARLPAAPPSPRGSLDAA